MKKLVPFLLLSIYLNLVQAQDKAVFNRLHGSDVKEHLSISINPSTLVMNYVLDGKDQRTTQPIENTRFYVRNSNENSVNVYLNFYNPLQLSVQSKTTEIEDPNSVVMNAFFKQFSAFTQISYETNNQVIPKEGFADEEREGNLGNYLLFQWNLEFQQNLQKKLAGSAEAKKVNDKLKLLMETEKYLYSKIKIKDTVFAVEEGIKHYRKQLYQAKTYEDFKVCMQNLKDFIIAVTDAKDVAKKNLDLVIAQLSNDYDLIDKLIQPDQKALFKKYTSSVVNATKGQTTPRFEYFDNLISNSVSLHDNCQKFIDKFFIDSARPEVHLKFPWDKEIINQYTYTIVALDENGTAIPNKTNEIHFSIGKKVNIAYFSSTGYLLTNYTEKKYGVKTEGGINTVERIGDNRLYGKPVFFLNGVISNSWNSGAYFFGQIGLSYDDGAIVPVGLGILIGNKFSLSGGGIIGRVKELPSDIRVGDQISDNTTLQNSLVDQLKGGVYFSVSYNIGTLGK